MVGAPGPARTSNGEPSFVTPKDTVGMPCDTQLEAGGTQVEICAALPCTCGTQVTPSVSVALACDTQIIPSVSVVQVCGTQVTPSVSVVEGCDTVITASDILGRSCVTHGKAGAIPFEGCASLSADCEMLGEDCEDLSGLAPRVDVTAHAGVVEPEIQIRLWTKNGGISRRCHHCHTELGIVRPEGCVSGHGPTA